jgi:peptidyl-prolyl cis-trans isomerase C
MSTALFPDLVVNGETISRQIIAAEAQNHPAPRDKPGQAWRQAANAVAVRTLLLQEARRRGLTPDPQEVGPGRLETEDEALIRELLDIAVEAGPPDEVAIHAEWARDPSRFRTPPLWEASHILCACDPRDEVSSGRAQARAAAVLEEARANPRRFPSLAARESDCGSKTSGGSLGQIRPGDLAPEFESALRDLAEGEIAGEPVATRYGWHVIRLDAVAEGQVLPFPAVREKIAEAMEKAAWASAARAFIAGLASEATITGADLQTI